MSIRKTVHYPSETNYTNFVLGGKNIEKQKPCSYIYCKSVNDRIIRQIGSENRRKNTRKIVAK